jgi:hypothetical protein
MANKSGDSSLHDWFNKSKSSDGKKGWVQLGGKYAGKPCAKQPGQKTKPKCGSSKMKRNLNKKEEAAAFRRKNKQDPNPNRKGKAKNVRTEETIDQLFRRTLEEKKAQKCWPGYEKKGTKKMFGKTYNNCVKKEEVELVGEGHKNCGCGKNPCETYGLKEGNKNKLEKTANELDAAVVMHTKQAKRLRTMLKDIKEGRGYRHRPSEERLKRAAEENKERRNKLTPAQRSDEDKSNKKFVDSLLNTEGAKPDYIDIDGDGDTEESMKKAVKDKKKGKKKIEEGKKDACYHKVKSRYSVWPSAYASGALVKCRKVGAKNWGNKSKKESYSWRDELDFVQEGAAWTKKAGKNKKGGLNEKGRKSYEAENPGSDLKAPVTGKVKKGGKAAKRRKSFCARMGGMKGPMKDEKGRPTRKALALRKWKCRKS